MLNKQTGVYLFGAGINCIGVINFFGSSNIIAIIDSDERLQGGFIYGIPIISLQNYINESSGETIVITGYFSGNEIAEKLMEHNITDYYISPYMQNGYYDNSKDIVQKLNLLRYMSIRFCTDNPLAREISAAMKEMGYAGNFYFDDADEIIREKTLLIVTNAIDKELFIKEINNYKQVMDINEIYNEKYAFRNFNLLKFKDLHKKKRCFVIGNGPSLKYKDLEKLYKNNEICFGVNRIYLAYEHTNWRPDYYVASDYFIIKRDVENIKKLNGIKFIKHLYKTDWLKEGENIYEYSGLTSERNKTQFSDDIVRGTYMGKTVVYDAIQIAAYMGFSEIYLLGVDMTLTANLNPEDEGAHFYKSPDTNEKLMKGSRSENLRAFKAARIHLESQGRTIKNATRDAQWDELERVDFDSLM